MGMNIIECFTHYNNKHKAADGLLRRLCRVSAKVLALVAALVFTAPFFPLRAQAPGSALDHMLQRPRVAKYYDGKRPFDHLFVDAGGGLNLLGSKHLKGGFQGEMNIGDWISPEHGLRLNLNGGAWRTQNSKSKYLGLGLDYMLNITALSQPGAHYSPKGFEVYGIAGLDLAYSRYNGDSRRGFGAHVALRGQVALSPATYFFAEPRVGLITDDVTRAETWHGYRPVATVNVGFGYRLPERGLRRDLTDSLALPSAANGLFLYAAGGPMLLFNTHPKTWRHDMGERYTVGAGKWLDAYNGLRLGVTATKLMQNGGNRVKSLGLQLDYMANLNNLFAGINPYRTFWVNAIVGGSYAHVAGRPGTARHNVFGGGVGLQANLRLSDAFTLTLEQRGDIYERDFAPRLTSFKNYDITSSLMLGLAYTYNRRATVRDSRPSDALAPYGAWSVGGGVANRLRTMNSGSNYMPVGRIAYTHWLGTDAWRVSLGGMMRRRQSGSRWAKATLGADWLADLTAHSYGVDPDRVLSVVLLAGADAGVDYTSGEARFAPDVHAGGQLRLRLGGNVRLVGEMQLEYMLGSRYNGQRDRCLPQATLGVEYAMRRASRKGGTERSGQRNFVSASLGTGLYTGNYGAMSPFGRKLSFVASLGYGRWIGGTSGVYGEVANSVVQRHGERNQNLTTVTAAWMLDVKRAVTGSDTSDDVFRLTGIVGPSLGVSSREGRDTRVAPGIHAAVQAGWRVTDNMELFVEPSATVFGNGIETPKIHPAEGELKLSVGAKVHF